MLTHSLMLPVLPRTVIGCVALQNTPSLDTLQQIAAVALGAKQPALSFGPLRCFVLVPLGSAR